LKNIIALDTSSRTSHEGRMKKSQDIIAISQIQEVFKTSNSPGPASSFPGNAKKVSNQKRGRERCTLYNWFGHEARSCGRMIVRTVRNYISTKLLPSYPKNEIV
jgi:hypothetical protein